MDIAEEVLKSDTQEEPEEIPAPSGPPITPFPQPPLEPCEKPKEPVKDEDQF